MAAVAKCVLMYDGHDPRAIEEYPMKDVLLYLRVRPELIPLLGDG